MNPSPYKLLNESELSRIKAAAESAFERWWAAWYGDDHDIEIIAMPADELAATAGDISAAQLFARASDDDRWVVAKPERGLYDGLAARLEKEAGGAQRLRSETTSVVREAIDASLFALCDELKRGGGAQGQQAKRIEGKALWNDACRRASGAAGVLIGIEGKRLAVVLSSRVVRELLGPAKRLRKGNLANRLESVQGRTLRLNVVAGTAELSVASLCSIAPGDVLVLDATPDSPFAVTGAGGETVARGFLGTFEGRKALQLIS